MYFNNKLVAGVLVLNMAFVTCMYYYFQIQQDNSNVISQLLDKSKRGNIRRENVIPTNETRPTIKYAEDSREETLANLKDNEIDVDEDDDDDDDDDKQNYTLKLVGTDSGRLVNLSSLPPDLYKFGKNVFDLLPEAYLPGYKSSCWVLNGVLKCLPYFYILGMPKCGTTDLWDKVVRHPDVKWAGKEPHWWTRGRLDEKKLSVYLSRSTNMVNKIQLQPSLKSRLIFGDGSASTFWDNRLRENWGGNIYDGPKYVTADIIHAAQPNAKLIVILRNPVSRVYSGYLYFNPKRKMETSPELFHEQIEMAIGIFNKCLKRMSFRGCTYGALRFNNERLQVRILIGLYVVYFRDWFRVYPRDQLKILRLEDWQSNCTGLLPEIFDHLELEKQSEKVIAEFCQKKLKNGNKSKLQQTGDMLPKTRKLLEEFYEGPNKELSLLLGSDKYLWR